jgi:hypothetical protein
MRSNSPKKLAAFIEQYCWRHYQQVWTAVLTEKLTNQSGEVGGTANCGRRLPDTEGPSSQYGFYTAVVVLKVMSRFNALAMQKQRRRKKGRKAVSDADIAIFATDIVHGVLQVNRPDAITIVQHALEQVSGFATEMDSAKTKPPEVFEEHVRCMGYRFARQLFLYCAAEKAAGELFEAWLKDPRSELEPDSTSTAHIARLIKAGGPERADAAPPPADDAPEQVGEAPPPQSVRAPVTFLTGAGGGAEGSAESDRERESKLASAAFVARLH